MSQVSQIPLAGEPLPTSSAPDTPTTSGLSCASEHPCASEHLRASEPSSPKTPCAPELLAPAGSPAMLHAAVDAGADAVYLGMGEFNARRNADNFDIDTLADACDYAHLRGARIYVAMNTIILPKELGSAVDLAKKCHAAGADAFIIQDLGLLAAVKRALPTARIHASTQMNIHSAAGIYALAELEIARITLARELSLGEIAHLCEVAAESDIEIETFAHGALCVCYSGQCLMSSMIGGRSANRGLCAQACRLPYELINGADPDQKAKSPGPHLLSPKDLCTIDRIAEMVDAGVRSFKIEGRMKSPEYVHEVVAVYRGALDAVMRSRTLDAPYEALADTRNLSTPPADTRSTSASGTDTHSTSAPGVDTCSPSTTPADARDRLEAVFSRGFTEAYLTGDRDNSIMSYQRPNNRGAALGRVRNITQGALTVATDTPLAPGDMLEVWTSRTNVMVEVPSDFDQRKGAAVVPLPADHDDPSKFDQTSKPNGKNHRGQNQQRGQDGSQGRHRSHNQDHNQGHNQNHNQSHGPNRRESRTEYSHIHKGDRVFRVRSAQAAFTDDDRNPRISVACDVRMHIGEPLEISFSLADDGSPVARRLFAEASHIPSQGGSPILPFEDRPSIVQATATGAMVEAARTRPVSVDDVVEHVGRMGQTPFKLASIDVDMDADVGIGFSQLHHVRAEALEKLADSLRALHESIKPANKPVGATTKGVQTGNAVDPASPAVPAKAIPATPLIYVLTPNPDAARAAKRAGANAVCVPAANYKRGQAVCAGVLTPDPKQAGYPKDAILAMPAIDHDACGDSREAALSTDIWEHVCEGDRVVVDSIGSLYKALELGARPEIGPSLPVTNPSTAELMSAFGAERIWLSPELNLAQIAAITSAARASNPNSTTIAPTPQTGFGVKIYGAQELMVTEHCLLMSAGECAQQCATCARRRIPYALRDRKGFDFPIVSDALGRSHLFNSVNLDNINSIGELIEAGVGAFMIDATLMDVEQTAQVTGRFVRALDDALSHRPAHNKEQRATTGHLHRGVL